MSLPRSMKKALERATYDKRELHLRILRLSASAKETEEILKRFSGKSPILSRFSKHK